MDKYQKEFSQLYDKYIEKIYRFVYLKVNSQEIAEDLTSETFLRGWQAFQKRKKDYNPSPTSSRSQGGGWAPINNPSAFLYQIARNLVIDFYREKGKVQVISAEATQIDDPRNNLEANSLLRSDIDTVKQCLSNLKGDYQNVIIWHYLDDLSIPEIAKITEKPEGTIRVTLHRALKALKNEMAQES